MPYHGKKKPKPVVKSMGRAKPKPTVKKKPTTRKK